MTWMNLKEIMLDENWQISKKKKKDVLHDFIYVPITKQRHRRAGGQSGSARVSRGVRAGGCGYTRVARNSFPWLFSWASWLGGGDARLCTWHTCTEPHVHTDAHTSVRVTGGPRMSPLDWADVHFLVLLLHQSCLRCWRWRGGARRGSAGHFSARFFATSCESIIFPNKMSSFF